MDIPGFILGSMMLIGSLTISSIMICGAWMAGKDEKRRKKR